MKLHVLPGQRFTCHSCTNCCRHWHVELLESEVRALPELKWPDGDRLADLRQRVLLRHAGRTYLAHQPDGACIFLDTHTGLCRVHEEFGATTKPVGCQLFPFHVTSTFEGEASVTVRYDCPSVRKNDDGQLVSEQVSDIEKLVKKTGLAQPFGELTCDLLEADQVRAIVQFAALLLGAFESDDTKAIYLAVFADWLANQSVQKLDREMLGAALPELQASVQRAMEEIVVSPGWLHRLVFRVIWGLHLRRDEDIIDGRASRLGRVVALARLTLGAGTPASLGHGHAKGRARAAKLFRQIHQFADGDVMQLHWRMVREKLESLQCMGSGNGGRDLLQGLRSVAMLYPLVVATAKHAAAERSSDVIEAGDVARAVAAIEHGFGRLAVLGKPAVVRFEGLLTSPVVFPDLIRSL